MTAPQSQVEQKEADVVVTRACRGCDGTGIGKPDHSINDHKWRAPFHVPECWKCAACQGSGQVTDRTSSHEHRCVCGHIACCVGDREDGSGLSDYGCDQCCGHGAFGEAACMPLRCVGLVTDRIPVADALADAETLRLNAYTCNLSLAAGHGGRAAQRLRYPLNEWPCVFSPGDFVAHHTTFAARAAFRAVPGLRGEQ